MPLSEDEQRILQEIEAQFYANDPQLAQQVSETTLYRHATRNIKWAVLGFVVGFLVLLTSFASSLFFGFVGFLAMLGCALLVEGLGERVHLGPGLPGLILGRVAGRVGRLGEEPGETGHRRPDVAGDGAGAAAGEFEWGDRRRRGGTRLPEPVQGL